MLMEYIFVIVEMNKFVRNCIHRKRERIDRHFTIFYNYILFFVSFTLLIFKKVNFYVIWHLFWMIFFGDRWKRNTTVQQTCNIESFFVKNFIDLIFDCDLFNVIWILIASIVMTFYCFLWLCFILFFEKLPQYRQL